MTTTSASNSQNLFEPIADIAFLAGFMYKGQQIEIPNSRDLVTDVINWAKAFETSFDRDIHGDDYILLIDDYASMRLVGDHPGADTLLQNMSASNRPEGVFNRAILTPSHLVTPPTMPPVDDDV